MSIDAVDLALYDHAIERRAGDPDEPSFSAWLADNAPVLVAECRRLRRADFILSEIRRRNPDHCFCGCHFPGPDGRVLHIVSCCDPCPACGDPIRRGREDSHLNRCHAAAAIAARDVRFERLARQLAAVESAARLLGGGDATRGATGRYCFCGAARVLDSGPAPSGSHAATCDDLNTLLTTAAGGEHAHRV